MKLTKDMYAWRVRSLAEHFPGEVAGEGPEEEDLPLDPFMITTNVHYRENARGEYATYVDEQQAPFIDDFITDTSFYPGRRMWPFVGKEIVEQWHKGYIWCCVFRDGDRWRFRTVYNPEKFFPEDPVDIYLDVVETARLENGE